MNKLKEMFSSSDKHTDKSKETNIHEQEHQTQPSEWKSEYQTQPSDWKSSTCSKREKSSASKFGRIHEREDPTIAQLSDMYNDKYVNLGKTGLRVSRISLGTMTFGEIDREFGSRPGQVQEGEAHKILDRYVELGGNFINTANFFPWFGSTMGESELIVGNWLKKSNNRQKIVLSTTVGMPTNLKDPNSIGLTRRHLIESVDRSLKRLQTNYIDILQVTLVESNLAFSDLIKNLNELVKSKKVNHIGVSDIKPSQIQKLIDLTKHLSAHPISILESEYNLLTRGIENELVDLADNENLALVVYSPLKSGYLTNNFIDRTRTEESRIEAASNKDRFNFAALAEPIEQMQLQNYNFETIFEVLQNISKKRNRTIAQVALTYVLQRNFVTSVVIGCSNIQQLEENMEALDDKHKLTYPEMHALNCASSLKMPYPYDNNLVADVMRYVHRPAKKAQEQRQRMPYRQPEETEEQREAERKQFDQFDTLYKLENFEKEKERGPVKKDRVEEMTQPKQESTTTPFQGVEPFQQTQEQEQQQQPTTCGLEQTQQTTPQEHPCERKSEIDQPTCERKVQPTA